jgi:REP element-mobilizing transposase RayT
MGRSRYKITEPTAPHFLTFTVLHWLPIFTRTETVNIVLNSFQFLQSDGLKIYAWVILENHLHVIAQSDDLSKDIQRFKSYTAKQLLQYLTDHNIKTLLDQFAFYKKAHKIETQYQFWQEGTHPELIQNDEMMHQKIIYIHENPVKRGYVDVPEHWRNSSARDYFGIDGLLSVCKSW